MRNYFGRAGGNIILTSGEIILTSGEIILTSGEGGKGILAGGKIIEKTQNFMPVFFCCSATFTVTFLQI